MTTKHIQEPGEQVGNYPTLPFGRSVHFGAHVEDGERTVMRGVADHTNRPISDEALREGFWAQPKAGKLCDWQIRQRCEAWGMIEPFVPNQVKVVDADGEPVFLEVGQNLPEGCRRVVSYGLSSYGYDMRLGRNFRVYRPGYRSIIDPHDFDESRILEDVEADYCDIPPNGYILANTMEWWDIPMNIICDAIGKSTYARCGLIVNLTPAESGWRGALTIELCNGTPVPIRVYAGEGIAQMRFYEGCIPDITYQNRAGGPGKYQDQPHRPIAARI